MKKWLGAIVVASVGLVCGACSDSDTLPAGPAGVGGTTTATGGAGGDATSASGGSMGVGASGAGGNGAGGGTGGAGGTLPFELTSPAYANGMMIPDVHTCPQGAATGVHLSPQLDWGPGPTGTASYAITFYDTTINFLHSVTWDIPASTLGLPEDVERTYEPSDVPGAKQAIAYTGDRGYGGPCSMGLNTYVFTLHAMPDATLSGLDSTSSRAEAAAAIELNSIGSTTLTGMH